jgi:hypothetical protein
MGNSPSFLQFQFFDHSGAIAVASSKCQSRRDLRIRHGQEQIGNNAQKTSSGLI